MLKYLKEQGINRTNFGIMLGLGETEEEVFETMQDLYNAKVDIVTIDTCNQAKHLLVKEFITPEQSLLNMKNRFRVGFPSRGK